MKMCEAGLIRFQLVSLYKLNEIILSWNIKPDKHIEIKILSKQHKSAQQNKASFSQLNHIIQINIR